MDNSSYLRSKGFNILTGEACGFSMRLLVDINQNAKEILEKFFDVNKLNLYENCNSGSIGRIMLPWSTLWDELVPFMMLLEGNVACYRVISNETTRDWYPVETQEEWLDKREKLGKFADDYGWKVDTHYNWSGQQRNYPYFG